MRLFQAVRGSIEVVLLGASLFGLCHPAAAQNSSAVTFTGGNPATGGGPQTRGYQFSISGPLLVTGLSYYDEGANGFLETGHPVGLWDQSGTLLAQTTVTNSSTLKDSFRF